MSEADAVASAMVREEYERIGCDVRTLQEVLGCGKLHAQHLWDGEVAWGAVEYVRTISVDGFAQRYQDMDDDDVSFYKFVCEPYSHNDMPEFASA
jgi:hypothetical protein